jgi:hypothetical protein
LGPSPYDPVSTKYHQSELRHEPYQRGRLFHEEWSGTRLQEENAVSRPHRVEIEATKCSYFFMSAKGVDAAQGLDVSVSRKKPDGHVSG